MLAEEIKQHLTRDIIPFWENLRMRSLVVFTDIWDMI